MTVAGAPSNQLYGYGLVVGLPGTGDQTTEVPYTEQSILNMLRNMGITLTDVTFMQPNDVASVMVDCRGPAVFQLPVSMWMPLSPPWATPIRWREAFCCPRLCVAAMEKSTGRHRVLCSSAASR